MVKKRKILSVIAFFSIALFIGQMLTWARASNRIALPPAPSIESMKGMNGEEKAKEIYNWNTERIRQIVMAGQERKKLMEKEAWKRLLRLSVQQWNILEPKIDIFPDLFYTTTVGARGYGGSDDFHWLKYSERHITLTKANTPDVVLEGMKIADELVNILEDENSKDEEIRKKIDELQQVREKARKELDQLGQELAGLLTTPRQEAIFLIMGHID